MFYTSESVRGINYTLTLRPGVAHSEPVLAWDKLTDEQVQERLNFQNHCAEPCGVESALFARDLAADNTCIQRRVSEQVMGAIRSAVERGEMQVKLPYTPRKTVIEYLTSFGYSCVCGDNFCIIDWSKSEAQETQATAL